MYNGNGDKMNDNQKRSLIITTTLAIIIVLIIYFNMMIFISGPYYQDDNIENISMAISNKLNATSIDFLNKYTLDEEIYVFEVVNDSGDNIIFYGNNSIYEQININTYDKASLESYVNDTYKESYEINLGYYNNKPIIALVNTEEDIVIDYYDYEEVFVWNNGD